MAGEWALNTRILEFQMSETRDGACRDGDLTADAQHQESFVQISETRDDVNVMAATWPRTLNARILEYI